MRFSAGVAAVAVSATVAQALSTGCQTQVLSLALGDLGNCLQLTNLLPLLSDSGSVVAPLNSYLTSLCASSTPTCSNSTLTSAQSSISSACSSDLSGGGTTAQEVQLLLSALNSYPQFHAGACAKNSTTNEYCLTSTLYQVQNITGDQLSTSFIAGLTSGNSQLSQAVDSGALCTGCVSTIYQQAVSANASIANTSPAKALQSKCGSSFGTSSSASGVSAASSVAASTSGSAATSAAASSSRSAGEAVRSISSLAPMAAAGVAMLGAVALGGAIVL